MTKSSGFFNKNYNTKIVISGIADEVASKIYDINNKSLMDKVSPNTSVPVLGFHYYQDSGSPINGFIIAGTAACNRESNKNKELQIYLRTFGSIADGTTHSATGRVSLCLL